MNILIIKGNGEPSVPEGDGVRDNNSSDGNKSDTNSGKSHHPSLDWREFRAKLYLVIYMFIEACHDLCVCHVMFYTCPYCIMCQCYCLYFT